MGDMKKMKNRTKDRRISRILKKTESVPVLLTTLLISGCSSAASYEMNADVARQIAIDAAGVNASSLQDVSSVPDKDGYAVTFANHKGKYKIVVSGSGEVLSYNFDSSGSSEKKSEAKKASTVSSEPSAHDSERSSTSEISKQDKKNHDSDSPVEGGLSSSELIRVVASHLGLVSYTDSEFQITPLDGQNVQIEVLVDNVPFTIVINGMTGDIYSTTGG